MASTATDTRRLDDVAGEMTHREVLEVLAGLMAALFTGILSSTIVANALPTIIGDLQGSQTQYTWIVTAALLATTVSTPIWSKLSDLYNKKLLVQAAICVFVAASVVAGFSVNVPMLIACRVFQGLGMGGLTALTQTIMGSIIAPRERGRYSGYLGATFALAAVSGPLLGGLIVDSDALGWRWTFFVCIPLAVGSLLILQRYLRLVTIRRDAPLDVLGAVLIAAAASLPLIWVSFAGGSFGWLSWQTAAFLVPAALFAIATVVVESRAKEPLVPLAVVRERTTALAIVIATATGVALFGSTVFLGQYFQVARGYSPTQAGLLTIPLMVGLVIASVGSGQIITRIGRWKVFLVTGSVLLALGLALLGTIDHTTPLVLMSIYMATLGLGLGMLNQNVVLAVQNTVDVDQIGAASGVVAFFRTLGGAIGVSVLGAILATRVTDKITTGLDRLGTDTPSGGPMNVLDVNALPAPVAEVVRMSYGDATGRIFMIAAAVTLIAVVAVWFIREVPLRTTVRKQATPD